MSYFTNFCQKQVKNYQNQAINPSTSSFVSVGSQFFEQFPNTLKQQCECALCCQKYNISTRVPMNLCKEQHHICLECFQSMKKGKKECPFCKQPISFEDVRKNRMIINAIEEAANKKGIKLKKNQNAKDKNVSQNSYGSFSSHKQQFNLPPPAHHQIMILEEQNQHLNFPLIRRQQREQIVDIGPHSCLKRLGLFVKNNFNSYIALTYFYIFVYLGITYEDFDVGFEDIYGCDKYIYEGSWMTLNQYAVVSVYSVASLSVLCLFIQFLSMKCSTKTDQLRGIYLVLYILLSLKFHVFNWIGIYAIDAQIEQQSKSTCNRQVYQLTLYLQVFVSYIFNGIMVLIYMCRNCCKCCCLDQNYA